MLPLSDETSPSERSVAPCKPKCKRYQKLEDDENWLKQY